MEKAALLKQLDLSEYVAFDFETTGLSSENDRIIEVAAILFENGEVKDTFVTLVNPRRPIPYIITRITGISDEMVIDAPYEKDVVNDLFDFIGDYPLIAHNIHFDIDFLRVLSDRYELSAPENDLYDTLQLSRAFLYFQPTHNLSALAEYFERSSAGAHRAESDTENTGFAFQDLVWEASSYPLDVISKLNAVMDPKLPNAKLFSSLATALAKTGDLKNGLVETKLDRPRPFNVFQFEGESDIDSVSVDDVFGEGGGLSGVIENFEERPAQLDYSRFIRETFTDGGVGIAEAGTGLGKSFAYLYPALASAKADKNQKPVIISCFTRHLQGQLFQKDLPMLAKALNTSVQAVVLKGRGNYLCKTRMSWLLADPSRYVKNREAEGLLPLIVWLHWTKTGDMDECPGFWNSMGSSRIYSLVQSEAGFCTGRLCTRHHGCFFGPVRQAVHDAQLIIVNHALLLAEIESPGFLPSYDTVLIDEAHNLVNVAYGQFTIKLDEFELRSALDRMDPKRSGSQRWSSKIKLLGQMNQSISGLITDLNGTLADVRESVKQFFEVIRAEVESKMNPEARYSQSFIIQNPVEEFTSFHQELSFVGRSLKELLDILARIKGELNEIDPEKTDYLELHQVLDMALERATDGLNRFILLTQSQKDDWVYWYEGIIRGQNVQQYIISVKGAPVDVAEDLSEGFFKVIRSSVLTSASFQVEESFDYLLRRTGLDRPGVNTVVTRVFPSPFYYNDQVAYFQYGAAEGASAEVIASVIYNCYKKYNKRMLVLFTSRKRLNDTADLLKGYEGGRDMPILAQTSRSSHSGLVRGLRQTENGILLGTDAMWEGLDLPGDLLEILIITKLPFDVPNEPLVKAYSTLLESEGKNSFMNYAVPEAVIRFRQGFGRLIRTISDSGIFIVTDERIVQKRYGSYFSDSIPVRMQVFTDPTEIEM
ncbi:MAG: helicase C-terminal domain-containing protein [Candidatus Marinimicrobia bacterium]|nr:helicase C-terminal domain-containing protein [Candidatus Neomarinimicrobiota bacterium]MDP7072645.1 helicase C-terminal domain-containing protein [Candidatus Neomarinimicrobiota bacterium]